MRINHHVSAKVLARRLILVSAILLPVAGTQSVRAVAPPDTAGVERLVWMAGHWRGEVSGVAMEEIWLKPSGGIMLGVHRDVFGPDRAFFEFLRIEKTDSGLVYFAQPLGRPATGFLLKEITGSGVAFENLTHDFPQRILYSRTGDVLRARVEGTPDGVAKVQEWEWRLVP